MVGRIPKHNVEISLDEDDYLWARLHGFEFSKRFREYLKMIRREVEISNYILIMTRPASRAEQAGRPLG